MSAKEDYVPSHPGLFEVDFRPGDFCSMLITRKDFEAGEVMTHLTCMTKGPRSYATVQCGPGPGDNVSVKSDLTYVNHSCDPNAAFDLSSLDQADWHLSALKRIAAGEPVTYFYPSTEWLMVQPFDCTCGSKSCLRRIEGAAALSTEELLARGTISPWVSDAIRQRDLAEGHAVDNKA
ncbi:hypothetical protein BJV74DRAFT_877772 [Russula compacta]|nr:hypothetical protein BJV74DRAFT_877772 [Russula compacta]